MGDSCKLCCYCWIDSLQVVTMEDMMRERIQLSWKIQTFQYDYLAHLKWRFILCHFLLFAFSWILMCVGCTERFMQPPHISRLIFAYAYIIIYA